MTATGSPGLTSHAGVVCSQLDPSTSRSLSSGGGEPAGPTPGPLAPSGGFPCPGPLAWGPAFITSSRGPQPHTVSLGTLIAGPLARLHACAQTLTSAKVGCPSAAGVFMLELLCQHENAAFRVQRARM